jgi:predicted double-glycine peptidase
MLLEILATLLLGAVCFHWGMRLGRLMLRKGATAQDLFKGKTAWSLLVLGLYVGLVVLALNLPQMQTLPLEVRVYGMRVTWTILRIALLGFCGLAAVISWQTARRQIGAIALLGLLGIAGFTASEHYFLAPIYPELGNNLQPNGVYRQTSMSSCAPAALATVLRRWNLDATESSVAKLAGTSRLGTSMPQLILALRELGLDGVELAPTWEQMQQINRPGVLGVWLFNGVARLPHAVALLAMNTNQVAIGDPAQGKIFILNRNQFARIWRNEYVPVFQPEEATLTSVQATTYLTQLGYRPTQDLPQAVRQFQQALGLKETGKLDTITALALSGKSGRTSPTLAELEIRQPR